MPKPKASPDSAAARTGVACEGAGASRQQLAALIRAATMSAITGAIAHDINQPLAAIVTDANAGLRWLGRPEPDLEEVRATLTRVAGEGQRASEMIAAIRSRFAPDREEPRAVSPYAIVDDVIGLLEAERDNRHVVVRKTIPAGLPQLMAERPQLALAIVCLVMNAFEAMEAVTDRDRVLTISAELCDSDSLLVTFEDTGTGINSDHKDRLFEAFFTTKAYHTGMGLTICRKIIESHGGRLWAAARHPHGAAFYVSLPAMAASDNQPGR